MRRCTSRNSVAWRRHWPPSGNSSIALTTRSGSIQRSAIGRRRSSNGFNRMLRKTRGRPQMRFLRHSGIYRSDVSSLLVNSGQGAASRWSGLAQAIGRDGKNTPCPSSAMSSGRLILDRVARQHGPSPLHQRSQHKSIAASMETNYHRTVTSVLTAVSAQGATPIWQVRRFANGFESQDLGRGYSRTRRVPRASRRV